MRGDALSRQLKLLQLLESRASGVRVDEAARELGTGRRTLYRDFEILQEQGFPLQALKEGRRARWRIESGYRHRLQLSLTWSEVLAISTGSELLRGLSGTLFHEGAVSALEKIRAGLPAGLAQRVRASEAGISGPSQARDYSGRAEILQTLVEAVAGRETVRVRYRSRTSGSPSSADRLLDPYHLRVNESGVYLIAHCHRSNARRTFLLDRFESVEPTDESFTPMADFEPRDFLSRGFGMWSAGPRVKLRFVAAEEIAHLFLEKRAHPSQTAQLLSDGSVEVRMDVTESPPLFSYLAGFGGQISRVRPERVRVRLVEVHRLGLRSMERPDGEFARWPLAETGSNRRPGGNGGGPGSPRAFGRAGSTA